ncbi:hypothetical protein FKM82_029132 [Ascaphus truei]
MYFPPILQYQHMLPSRVQFRRAEERCAPQPPLSEVKRGSVIKEELSNIWPTATLRRQPGRRHGASVGKHHQQQHEDLLHPARLHLEQVPRGITWSYQSVMHPVASTFPRTRRDLTGGPHSSYKVQQRPMHHDPNLHEPKADLQAQHKPTQQQMHFSLCLTPEAILVIQKRNLEKKLSQQQPQRGLHANTKRIFARSPVRCPRDRGDLPQRCPLQSSAPDVGDLVKVSLLNDRHRYDDVEYEEEEWWTGEGRGGPGAILDEGLIRKCTEWLRGVEMATVRDGNLNDKLQTLPHLNTH